MNLLVALVLISIPMLAVAVLIAVIVLVVRTVALQKRVAALENRHSIEANHPLSRLIRDLQERVARLERHPPEPAAQVPDSTRADSMVSAQQAPAVRPEPSAEIPPQPLETAPRRVPPPAPTRAARATASAESPPTASPPALRRRIEWERWIGVRAAAAAGGVVLALAALLFFQYSIEHGLISPAMRVVLGVVVGICCLVASEWLVRRDQAAAASALAGAGVVILYGATWAAQNLYGLIGTLPAFVLMVLITVVCVVLAISRNAPFIAVLGLLGGFATPILVASEVDSPAALFGYILLLDLGLLWLARARGWPMLAVLSLVGTTLHQVIWIFGSMDEKQAGLGIAVLATFGIAFLLTGSGDREPSALWRATRAAGVAIPFAFALHFADTTRLAENPWPLGMLLIILSAGACWLARQEIQDAAMAAAGASVGIMALWFLNQRPSPALAWQAVAICVALATLFTVAAEMSRRLRSADRLGLAALLAMLGFLCVLVVSAAESRVVRPWPWVAGWALLGGLLVLHSRWPRRSWAQLAAGLGPAIGFCIAVDVHGQNPGSLESRAWLGLIGFVAVVFQILAVLAKDGERWVWAERTAGATSLALMVSASMVGFGDRFASLSAMGTVLVLGLLAMLSATRLRSGGWYLAATVATAFWQTALYFDVHELLAKETAWGAFLGLLLFSAIAFTVWPVLFTGAFRSSRPAWWAAALAGPFWFVALKSAFVSKYGDGAVGLVPVALAAIAFAAAMWSRRRLPDHEGTRRTAVMWYLAVAISLVSVAIPLQLEKEWITIGWALNGLAILALWARFDNPGLKYFGLALLGAATVRLVANPAVLDYHPRAATPVLSWLSYTYLVPALALVFSGRILKSREIERITDRERQLYPTRRAIGAAACAFASVVVVFVWINLAIADIFATGPNLELSLERLPARDAATSIAWAVYALILLAIGVRSRSGSLRWLSLGLFVLTLGKVFLHDLGELEDLYRVGSLVGLAASLIIVSLIYQRFVFRSDPD